MSPGPFTSGGGARSAATSAALDRRTSADVHTPAPRLGLPSGSKDSCVAASSVVAQSFAMASVKTFARSPSAGSGRCAGRGIALFASGRSNTPDRSSSCLARVMPTYNLRLSSARWVAIDHAPARSFTNFTDVASRGVAGRVCIAPGTCRALRPSPSGSSSRQPWNPADSRLSVHFSRSGSTTMGHSRPLACQRVVITTLASLPASSPPAAGSSPSRMDRSRRTIAAGDGASWACSSANPKKLRRLATRCRASLVAPPHQDHRPASSTKALNPSMRRPRRKAKSSCAHHRRNRARPAASAWRTRLASSMSTLADAFAHEATAASASSTPFRAAQSMEAPST